MSCRKFSLFVSYTVLAAGGVMFCWMLAEFIIEKRTEAAPSFDGYERWRLSTLELSERPRFPIGEPVVGDAMDDYFPDVARNATDHRFFRLFEDGERKRSFSAEEVRLLEAPATQRIVTRFARAQRRENVGESSDVFISANPTRIRLIAASAAYDASRGRPDSAWRKGVALIRFAQDLLVRESLASATIAAVLGKPVRAELARLARNATPQLARAWLSDVEKLTLDQLPPWEIPAALVIGESEAMLKWTAHNPESRQNIALQYELATHFLTHGTKPNAVGIACGSSRLNPTFCDVLEKGAVAHADLGRDLAELREILSVAAKGGNVRQ